MKKFFSLIALVGVFAACQKENLKTAFSVNPGEITITASAISIEGKNITDDVFFSFDDVPANGVIEGNVCTIIGSATETFSSKVNVIAVWKGVDGSKKFEDSKIIDVQVVPGGVANYTVSFTLGEFTPIDKYQYKVEDVIVDTDTDYLFFFDEVNHAAGHEALLPGHDNIPAYEGAFFTHNQTEFIRRGYIKYSEISGTQVDEDEVYWDEDVELLADFVQLFESFDGDFTYTEKDFYFTVSAYSQYCVNQVVKLDHHYVTLTRSDNIGNSKVIGSFYYWDASYCGIFCYESAIPGHEAHYIAGHGHDDPEHSHAHGSNNAGGGIVYAD